MRTNSPLSRTLSAYFKTISNQFAGPADRVTARLPGLKRQAVNSLYGQPVVLALSGIGKVAAATTAAALIERFGVARIVFTGVAGGVGEGVRVGDVVVAHDYVQHDMDVSPLFERWQVPGYPGVRLPCDAGLSAHLFVLIG